MCACIYIYICIWTYMGLFVRMYNMYAYIYFVIHNLFLIISAC